MVTTRGPQIVKLDKILLINSSCETYINELSPETTALKSFLKEQTGIRVNHLN